jgi:hypothetical protein
VLSFRGRTQTQNSFSGLWSVFLESPLQNKQIWSCLLSSILRSFWVTGTVINQDMNPGQGCGLCFCNLLSKTTLVLSILLFLVFELQEQPSPALELRIFLKFWPFWNFFLVTRNRHAKFGANQFICVSLSYLQQICIVLHSLYALTCTATVVWRQVLAQSIGSIRVRFTWWWR